MTKSPPLPLALSHFKQGQALEDQGRPRDALPEFLRALDHDPNSRPTQEKVAIFGLLSDPERSIRLANELGMKASREAIWRHLGYVAFRAWSMYETREEALESIRFWLKQAPDNKEHFLELARYASTQGEPELARQVYEQAFKIHSSSLLILEGLINEQLRLGLLTPAHQCLQDVLQQAHEHPALLKLLGRIQIGQGLTVDADKTLRRVLSLTPDDFEAWNTLMYLGLMRSDHPADALKKDAEAYGAAIRRFRPRINVPPFHSANTDSPGARRLRVGLCSADLRLHPVGFFMEGFLRHHDRSTMEVIVFSDSDSLDPQARLLRSFAVAWHSTRLLDASAYVKFVREQGIDVLIDLAGHTSFNRLTEFSYRMAPSQGTFLGYAGTTGAPEMDFRIADDDTELPELSRSSTEPVIHMKGSYFCFSPNTLGADIPIQPLPALHNAHFQFGCFTQRAKVTKETVEVWINILREFSDAILILRCREFADETTRHQMYEQWSRQGGNTSQLSLKGWVFGGDHLALYDEIDVILNTTPFHLATNMCDALWMGVPVISLLGQEHRSRMALSIGRAAGFEDWTSPTVEGMIDQLRLLTSDRAQLNTLRHTMRSRLLTSELFNGPDFALRLGEAIKTAQKIPVQ